MNKANSQCRYKKLVVLGEGTYGRVYKAYDKETQQYVAVKKCLMDLTTEGFPPTALREVSFLQSLNHPSVVKLNNIIATETNMYLVFEFLEEDLGNYIQNLKTSLPLECIRKFMVQLLKGVYYLHSNRIIHRDLKPQNLLLDKTLNLKIGDFGLARGFQVPLRPYTNSVQTLWYRAPEILLGSSNYSMEIDMWSVGCIFGELVRGEPLFPTKSYVDQLWALFGMLGTPTEKTWPGVSSLPYFRTNFPRWEPNDLKVFFPELDFYALDLLKKLLIMNPRERITITQAIKHPFFSGRV